MTKKVYEFCRIPLLLVLAVTSLRAQDTTPASPREQLQQLMMQLQKSPADQALREKIIALALTLNPKPATPDAASMAEGAAEYAFKNAKVNSDFSDAAKQYEKALLQAPWLAADYFNCGVAHEKAGENKEAIRNFNLYLLAAPNADDAVAVKKRIGGVAYAAQKVDDAASEQARAATEQARVAAQQAKVYEGLDGGVWTLKERYFNNAPIAANAGLAKKHAEWSIEIHGRKIEAYYSDDLNSRGIQWDAIFTSRHFRCCDTPPLDVTISDDGQLITYDSVGPDGTSRGIYHRVR
jgi:tetratricopeptide (TPR) repeat protein